MKQRSRRTRLYSRTALSVWILTATTLPWSAGCLPDSFQITPVYSKPDLVERSMEGAGWWTPKIALIDIDGILVNDRSSAVFDDGEHPISLLVEKLEKAREDPFVKAVILRINSPGGTVVASEMMHDEISRFREETGKPVVAVMMDVAASGGYYIACACDHIVAYPSTITGSIGVIMQLFEVTGTMAKLGVTAHTLASGEFKSAGSPFERLSAERQAIFENIINDMYERFVNAVITGRPRLSPDQVRSLADGRIYTATQAMQAGLIDEISTLRHTVESIRSQLDLRDVRVVRYSRSTGHDPNIYARSSTYPGTVVNLHLPRWLDRGQARFMYLWVP